jgi:hypothetical protein
LHGAPQLCYAGAMDNTKDMHHMADVLQGLCAAHGKKYTSTLLKFYWNALQDLTREEFDKSVKHVTDTCTWFPQPAHFRRALQVGWL